MSTSPQDWRTRCEAMQAALQEACTSVSVASGPSAFTKELSRLLPEVSFRRTLCRGGWYRLGGVVGSDGSRVSDDLEGWVTQELANHDEDIGALCDAYAGSGLQATRLVGRTHYFVASTGDGPVDFLQLEIEDLQETVSHPLFDSEQYPGQVEELIDPDGVRPGLPVGLPWYAFRRLISASDLLADLRAKQPEAQPIHRFVEDWGQSSAGNATLFANHWLLGIREHLDRYRQTITRVHPVLAINGDPPHFTAKEGTRELALHDALVAFDRQAGYPFAWFFHMLTTKAVPHWVARVVTEDALAGFAYLPRRDETVVRNWLHRPYAF